MFEEIMVTGEIINLEDNKNAQNELNKTLNLDAAASALAKKDAVDQIKNSTGKYLFRISFV